ncbi:hypothetical protein UlMin_034065 [Ulmus minor]
MDSQLLEILSLSYYDLPSPLKSCFLYFGIFPEDSSILDERLYGLWIAEGFIEARGNRTLEEVAEAYLNELIQRNLVTFQLVVGEGKVCGVHDLMHEVILSRADKVCLCQTWDENESRFRGAGRRLRISGSNENVLKNVGASTLRSVFVWDIYDELIEIESFVVTLFKRFKLLEVMDFQRVPLNTLPKEVGNLFLLKYLSLKETNVKVLPKSIRNLQKLQTLDIRDTLIRELPAEINELRNLRHLLAYKYNYSIVEGVRMHEGFGNLENLQTLTTFEAHPGGVGLVKELGLLRKLRWLDVSKISSETWRGVCASVTNMDHLQRFSVIAKDTNEVLDLLHISSPPHLRELVVVGRLQNFQDMIPLFRNLRGLTLKSSWLSDDPCKCLKELPNLEILRLSHKAYVGEELHFEKGGFEKLKQLQLYSLEKLKRIEIDGGALPALEKLVLYACPLLEEYRYCTPNKIDISLDISKYFHLWLQHPVKSNANTKNT